MTSSCPAADWKGPVWINVNAVLCYALVTNGYTAEAEALAADLVRTLANDLRANGQWHENYHAEDPAVFLASPGFLSWNLMGADLLDNVRAGVDPMSLE